MIMADVLKIFLLVVGSEIVAVCYWLIAVALFPRLVDRADGGYGRPILSLLVGGAIGVPFVGLAMVLNAAGNAPARFVALLAVALPLFAGLFGSAALCRRIGQGLPSPVDVAQPWRRTLRGGVLLAIAALLPFVGWFLVLPGTLLSGLGAAVLGARRRKEGA